jgi:hypothetical protein
MNNGQDKKLKHNPFIMRSQDRTDYKIEPSKALDILAAAISVVAAVLIWLNF